MLFWKMIMLNLENDDAILENDAANLENDVILTFLNTYFQLGVMKNNC